jgi:hypothetical protein
MKILRFNESTIPTMGDTEIEIVEDCMFRLIEDWGLIKNEFPPFNKEKWGDKDWYGSYRIIVDRYSSGFRTDPSIWVHIEVPHYTNKEVNKNFEKSLNIFYDRLKSNNMWVFTGKTIGKREFSQKFISDFRRIATRSWDLHIHWNRKS